MPLIVIMADGSTAAQVPGKMAWRFPALVVFFLLAPAAQSATPVSCLDASGNAVDWWIALKVPIVRWTAVFGTNFCVNYSLKTRRGPKQAPQGSKYGYIDASMSTPSFVEVLNDELAELSNNPLVRWQPEC